MANYKNLITSFEGLILILSILIFIYYYVKRRIFYWGSKIPGPKPWPLIGNAWYFIGSEPEIITKLKKFRSYKLYAVWLGHELNVFVNSPEYAEIYCKSSQLLQRSHKAKLIDFIAPKGLLFANGKEWTKAKKIMSAGLSYRILKNSIPIFEEQAEILSQRLKSQAGKQCFQLIYPLQECIFDIIAEMSLEYELKAQKSEFTIIKDINMATYLSNKRFSNAFYQWNCIYKLSSEGKKFFSAIESLLGFLEKNVNDKMKRHKEQKRKPEVKEDFQDSEKKTLWKILADDETLSLSEIKDHILTLVLAGLETTSNELACVLILLALYPDVQEKVYQEVTSNACDYNEDELQQLPYLDRVIKETMRLFPGIPLGLRRATEDVQMGNYLIPAGSEVFLNIYELHRDPEQYENPHQFNPDNFLPENIAKRHSHSYLPFLSGLRNCVGGKFSLFVMKTIAAELIRNYKFECDYKTIDDIKFRGEVALHLVDGGLVKILER